MISHRKSQNVIEAGSTRRRTKIPNKPNKSANLWTIMKNSIGKDLSKIPMPINFSEPLSMLQRLTEDFEYARLLDYAAGCKDSSEQLTYVAVFTISSYGWTAIRVAKPFNPLLGETYECDRRSDLGWRAISEQVSHHPPIAAQFCEGKKWKCWQEFSMLSKFRGKYLSVTPIGIAHLTFDSGDHYTWRKVTTTVHNIIFGKLWIDNTGDMEIINHSDGSKCFLSYHPFNSYDPAFQRRVKGWVKDKKGNYRWVIDGKWDSEIKIAQVIGKECTETAPFISAWVPNEKPKDNHKFYNLSLLACQLNEMEKGVAPTDSRFRPDQRLMENGNWDEANIVKVKLEEKQRAVRKEREASQKTGTPLPPHEPVWFELKKDHATGEMIHTYKGTYWEAKAKGDWKMCRDIYL